MRILSVCSYWQLARDCIHYVLLYKAWLLLDHLSPQKKRGTVKDPLCISNISCSDYTSAASYFDCASICARTALFFTTWLSADSFERLPVSIFLPSLRNWTCRRETVLFLLSFLFKRVTPMVFFLIFYPVRSEADSNRCRRFCRPLPSHSAIRPC